MSSLRPVAEVGGAVSQAPLSFSHATRRRAVDFVSVSEGSDMMFQQWEYPSSFALLCRSPRVDLHQRVVSTAAGLHDDHSESIHSQMEGEAANYPQWSYNQQLRLKRLR